MKKRRWSLNAKARARFQCNARARATEVTCYLRELRALCRDSDGRGPSAPCHCECSHLRLLGAPPRQDTTACLVLMGFNRHVFVAAAAAQCGWAELLQQAKPQREGHSAAFTRNAPTRDTCLPSEDRVVNGREPPRLLWERVGTFRATLPAGS